MHLRRCDMGGLKLWQLRDTIAYVNARLEAAKQ